MIRFLLSRHFRRIGRIGGRARAQQQREPFKAKARVLREECGLPASEALSEVGRT